MFPPFLLLVRFGALSLFLFTSTQQPATSGTHSLQPTRLGENGDGSAERACGIPRFWGQIFLFPESLCMSATSEHSFQKVKEEGNFIWQTKLFSLRKQKERIPFIVVSPTLVPLSLFFFHSCFYFFPCDPRTLWLFLSLSPFPENLRRVRSLFWERA
jgi:hypothetical protein